MKKHFPKIIAVTLGVAALAVSVPVSAFAKSSKPLSYLYTYQLTFDGYDTMSLSPDDTGTITAPALPEGAQYWQCNGKHVMPGEQFSYDQLDIVAGLGNGGVDIVRVEVTELLVGKKIVDITVAGEFSVCALSRQNQTFLPTLGTVLQKGDVVYFNVLVSSVKQFKHVLGLL